MPSCRCRKALIFDFRIDERIFLCMFALTKSYTSTRLFGQEGTTNYHYSPRYIDNCNDNRDRLFIASIAENVSVDHARVPWRPQTIATAIAMVCHVSGCTTSSQMCKWRQIYNCWRGRLHVWLHWPGYYDWQQDGRNCHHSTKCRINCLEVSGPLPPHLYLQLTADFHLQKIEFLRKTSTEIWEATERDWG